MNYLAILTKEGRVLKRGERERGKAGSERQGRVADSRLACPFTGPTALQSSAQFSSQGPRNRHLLGCCKPV